jgi:ferrous iron transport protein B
MTIVQEAFTIALAGQPNTGKSSVFNALTGMDQYVSNWPGKTCEQKTGVYYHDETMLYIVDLPGAYSLSANSLEERITRDFVIKCRPDVILVILDAVALERNLYLVAELLSQPVPLVLGLNRIDLAAQQGIHIETHVLEAALGLPVIPLVAQRGEGMQALIAAAAQVAHDPQAQRPSRPEIRQDHQAVLQAIQGLVAAYLPEQYPLEWATLKLLEGDEEITQVMRQQMDSDWEKVQAILMQHDDAFLAVASGRYEWIGRMMRAAVTQPRAGQLTRTDRIDRLATHPVWGLLLLVCILGTIFWLTYSIGAPLQAWMEEHIVAASADLARSALQGMPEWLASLVADGIITGVGTVLTLLPILAIFFSTLGLLEDAGYMARAAFVMDRFMHLMGLHGKSFLPIFLGFGCNVPGVMGARIIEAPKARLITILITPIVPCTARMAVVAFLAPIFFSAYAVWVSWGLVALSLVVLTLVGIVLHEKFLGGEHNEFIMELPLYQAPNVRIIGQGVWQRSVDFLKTAGSIILIVSVILWALSTFPSGEIETSYLAFFGRLLAPLGSWMGLEWEMMVALLTSFVRKENTIPTLAVLYGANGETAGLAQTLHAHLAPAAALAFLAVQVLFIPCVATLATIRQETKSWRWTLLSSAMLLGISLSIGIIIYQLARLAGWGI